MADDLDAIRACPKADLHVHAIGGGSRAFLLERTGRDVAPVDGVMRSMSEMHAWADEHLADLFAGPEGRALAFEAAFVQAKEDGVTLIEIGEERVGRHAAGRLGGVGLGMRGLVGCW